MGTAEWLLALPFGECQRFSRLSGACQAGLQRVAGLSQLRYTFPLRPRGRRGQERWGFSAETGLSPTSPVLSAPRGGEAIAAACRRNSNVIPLGRLGGVPPTDARFLAPDHIGPDAVLYCTNRLLIHFSQYLPLPRHRRQVVTQHAANEFFRYSRCAGNGRFTELERLSSDQFCLLELFVSPVLFATL